MPVTLSRTKIPARRPRILKRVRLLDALHENVHRRLTFVCAPAGYGKTTLLQSFAADVDMTVCWYQVGPEDGHLSVFLDHVSQSVEHQYPGFRAEIALLSVGHADIDPEAAATQFINAAVRRIDNYTALVMDDYHRVSMQPDIVRFMDALLGGLPEQLRLVVSSRNVYGIPTAHLFVQQEIAILAADDLKFRPQELSDLSRYTFHRVLSSKELEEIAQATDGWAMATVLALQQDARAATGPRLLNAQEQVFGYIRDELLNHLGGNLVRFLLVTALVDEFTVEQANWLLDEPDTTFHIRELFERNLFIARRDLQGEEVFSYHQLFRDFLLDQFSLLEVEVQSRAHARAAEWFERKGATEMAIRHWFAAGEERLAAGLINRASTPAYASGRQDLLDEWFSRLEGFPELITLAPHLLLNRAKSLINRGALDQVAGLLDMAEPVFAREQDFESLCNLLVTRGMLHRFSGEYETGLDLALRASGLATEHGVSAYYAFQAARLEGISHNYLGRIELALERLDAAAKGLRALLTEQPGDRVIHELIATLSDIGYIAIMNGPVQQAEDAYLAALGLADGLRANRGDQAICTNNAAYLHYIKGDYARAWEMYEKAYVAARDSGWRSFMADVLNGQGDLLRDLGEYTQATVKYNEAMSLAGGEAPGSSIVDSLLGLAEVERLQENFSRAQEHVREAGRLGGFPSSALRLRAQNAAIFLAMGHPDLALETLANDGNDLAEPPRPTQDAAVAAILLSVAQYRAGQPAAAAQASLQRALETTARLGYNAFFVTLLREFGGDVRALAAGMKSPQLRSLLRSANKELPDPGEVIGRPAERAEVLPPRIEVCALGREEVRLDGERLTSTDWHSIGARNLFFYILEHQPVSKEQIALAFWPDFSRGKVNSNFHTTLWRARHALGRSKVIDFDGEGYAILARLYYDAAEFSAAVDQMESIERGTAEWRTLAEQAVSLYQGDFLPTVDMDWARERAVRLRQRFLMTLAGLAEFQQEAGRFAQALELFSRAVDMDPYEDRWRLGMLRCYLQMDQRGAARKYYQAYARLLFEELGVEPGSELIELAQTLE